jgi:LDH2 family malate/lactate/ureidoglycolate dehydrogenase
MPAPSTIVSSEALGQQIAAIFRAWGMSEAQIEPTVDVMLAADIRGIDSHGAVMMTLYEDWHKAGLVTLDPEVKVVRQTPVTALIDGDGGLGHYPSTVAMNLAMEKCAETGVGIVSVRNSNHYGAAGVYALWAAERGFIGVSSTAVYGASVVPTFSAVPMFGTNPLAFAAPTKTNRPFLMDMASSTVAIGKLKIAALADKPVPEGWTVDPDGHPVTDPHEGLRHRLMTPLGGTRELSSHKGYCLAAMVEILSTVLPGASFAPLRKKNPERFDVGHFFMAMDPANFRDEGDFEDDMDAMIDALHATQPADDDQPVLVAGDPEYEIMDRRRIEGIPIPAPFMETLRGMAERAGCAFSL